MPFLFEKLDSYNKAVAFADEIDSLLVSKRGQLSTGFRDQLTRAALSISLNLAEGNGRWHAPDKRQFFYVARGSIFECIPMLQILKKRELIDEKTFLRLYSQSEDLSKMISGLIKSVDSKGPTRGAGGDGTGINGVKSPTCIQEPKKSLRNGSLAS
jgi:four helix bundle protein